MIYPPLIFLLVDPIDASSVRERRESVSQFNGNQLQEELMQ
jgi:hypothetical protein